MANSAMAMGITRSMQNLFVPLCDVEGAPAIRLAVHSLASKEWSMSNPAYDAILLVSFGGPEKNEDVLPFLEQVTKGRGVPRERLVEVAEHYYARGGKSPINEQNRALIAALEEELKAHEIDLPIYFANRCWHPFIEPTLKEMRAAGVKRALAFVTSAYSSYSGCRQYREAIQEARENLLEAPEVEKVRAFFNHPLFIDVLAERLTRALEKLEPGLRASARIAFTAHSIPNAMAAGCDYEEQLHETARLVAERLGRTDWQVVYQSRSGPPQVPWLEPDVVDHVKALAQIGTKAVVVSPIGFLSDHMEVIYDLDEELADACEELGVKMVRAGTPGTHPVFVQMVRELLQERLDGNETRSVGTFGARPFQCAPGCCEYTRRRPPRRPA